MTISQSESGLTVPQYASIQAAIGDLSASVVLQRYGPVWTEHDTSPARSGDDFDAAIASTYLVRAYVGGLSDLEVEKLADESGGDETWASVATGVHSDIDVAVSPSLATDGLTVRVFYYGTAGKIKYIECADISSGTFGVAQDVGTVSDVIYLAAVSTTKVYYITENANYNRILHVYETSSTKVTYYFDGFNAGEAWETDAANMVDNDTGTRARTIINGRVQLLNTNTCPGTNLGTITKVETRLHAHFTAGASKICIQRPVFGGGDGDDHSVNCDGGFWKAWQDITEDTNAPATWSWANVQALDMDMEAQDPGGGLDIAKVEVRVTYTPAWSNTDSDIYWPYAIHAFDAVTFETGKDLLTLATDLPPLIGTRVVGAEVTQEVNKVQGVVNFWVSNGRWSDHAEIDVIDRINMNPEALNKANRYGARLSLRQTLCNSLLFTSYTRCGGSDDYPYGKAAVSRSADGVNWEFPELIESLSAPYLILARSDYLYAVGVSKTFRSPCCSWAGQTPVEYDLTSYILGLESNAAEIRSSQVQVSNPADALASTLAKSDDRIQAVYKLGYIVGGTSLRAQVSVEDVVERAEQAMLPKMGLALTTRDFLSRVNRVRSDYAAEWPGIQAGHDTFNDPSGTGYGGMRHMAPYKPSWKTPGSEEIHLVSKNKEGLVVSTFVADALNGSAETAFQVATASNGEYAGIAFRTFDKDNLHYFIYDEDTDKLKLIKGVGTDTDDDDERDNTTLATSASAMTWSVNIWYWLKVVVRYSLVYCFYSTDGITWTAVTWNGGTAPIELAGSSTLPLDQVAGDYTLSGRFGLIGYGYSADDAWPPYEPPPPWNPPMPPEPWPTKVYFASRDKGVYYTENFSGPDESGQPTWTEVNTGLDLDVRAFAVDPTNPQDYQYCYCADSCVYRRKDQGDWVVVLDKAAAIVLTGDTYSTLDNFAIDKVTGALYLTYWNGSSWDDPWVIYSTDHGDNWLCTQILPGSITSYFGPIVAHNGTVLLWEGYRADIFYSYDGGASFTKWEGLCGTNYWNNFYQDPLTPTQLFCWDCSTEARKVVVPTSVAAMAVVAQPDGGTGSMWFSRLVHGFIRWVNHTGTRSSVWVTHDWWATYTTSPGTVRPYPKQIYAPGADADKIIIANNELGVTYTHAILVMDGDLDITPGGKGGYMTDSIPYTGSIPNDCGEAAGDGIQAVGWD